MNTFLKRLSVNFIFREPQIRSISKQKPIQVMRKKLWNRYVYVSILIQKMGINIFCFSLDIVSSNIVLSFLKIIQNLSYSPPILQLQLNILYLYRSVLIVVSQGIFDTERPNIILNIQLAHWQSVQLCNMTMTIKSMCGVRGHLS